MLEHSSPLVICETATKHWYIDADANNPHYNPTARSNTTPAQPLSQTLKKLCSLPTTKERETLGVNFLYYLL
jgi:hypothetical protein